jgi:hypothetical protein
MADWGIGPIKSECILSIGCVARVPDVDDSNDRRFDFPAMHPSQVEGGSFESIMRIPMRGGDDSF